MKVPHDFAGLPDETASKNILRRHISVQMRKSGSASHNVAMRRWSFLRKVADIARRGQVEDSKP